MSVLMDAIIICMFEDDKAIEQVNKYLYEEDEGRHQQFRKMDNSLTGGSKVSSLTTYQACFNHIIPEVIIKAFLKADWRRQDTVLIFDHEFDDKPQIIFKSDGEWIENILG